MVIDLNFCTGLSHDQIAKRTCAPRTNITSFHESAGQLKKLIGLSSAAGAVAAIVFASTLFTTHAAVGSDHQDAPLALSRAGADTTDLFVFPAADPKNVVLVMDVHALIPRSMGSLFSFDPGVMYQFKIATDGGAKETKVIQFKPVGIGAGQTVEMYGPAAPSIVGTQSTWVGKAQTFAVGKPAKLSDGVHVFAGARKDPFFFDLAQFLSVVPERFANYHVDPGAKVPAPSATCFNKTGVDFFNDFNVLSFVVEMPRAMLAGPDGHLGVIHVYETTSLPGADGRYDQVQRLGRPAVKEAFEMFEDHDATNKSAPWNDALLSNSIVAFTTTKAPGGAGRSMQTAQTLQHILIPDELAADLTSTGPAGYLGVETKAANFGGRGPSTPVMTPSLGAIFGDTVAKLGLAPDDHAETPCLTSDNVKPTDRGVTRAFPYLGSPI